MSKETTRNKLLRWIGYWDAMKMVAFDEIRAFDQTYQARKFCQCLRNGWMSEITDLQLWRAILDYRAGKRGEI